MVAALDQLTPRVKTIVKTPNPLCFCILSTGRKQKQDSRDRKRTGHSRLVENKMIRTGIC
jgi:hypothetical protein